MAQAARKTPTFSDLATAWLTWVATSLVQRGTDKPATIPPVPVTRSASGADRPTAIPARGWWAALRGTYVSFSDNRLLAIAAGVTFYALLALFPGIAAFVSLYGLVADATTIGDHLNSLGGLLPGGAMEILTAQIARIATKGGGTLGFSFAIGLVTSLWSANAGIKALFDALNVVYGETETRGFVRLNLASLSFTLGALLFGLFALAAIAVLPLILQTVGLGAATQWILWAARWPALVCGLILWLASLYRFGPARQSANWRWITPGSTLAALAWLGFSMIFSWYVANFGSYNETYGTLGAVVGFMTWIWLSTAIILIGGALNAELEKQADSAKAPSRPGHSNSENAPASEPPRA